MPKLLDIIKEVEKEVGTFSSYQCSTSLIDNQSIRGDRIELRKKPAY